MFQLLIFLLLVGVVIAYFAFAVKIVRPFEKGLVERLGSYRGTVEPGMRLILPFVDKVHIVDMREQLLDVPPEEVITADNVVVSVDAVIYYEPTDPSRLLYNVEDYVDAISKLAQTTLRNVIGDVQLDEALTSRERTNTRLRAVLEEATDSWGLKVQRVEIQRIDPPMDVTNAMHEQMKAERRRRAFVLEAQGVREAEVTRAEGDKQAAILRAQAQKQQDILEAQGRAEAIRELADAERLRQQLTAAGEAEAIRSVYSAIHDGEPTNDLIAIKYLEALAKIADGNATKIYLPADTSNVMGSLAGVAELFRAPDTDDIAGAEQLPPPQTSAS